MVVYGWIDTLVTAAAASSAFNLTLIVSAVAEGANNNNDNNVIVVTVKIRCDYTSSRLTGTLVVCPLVSRVCLRLTFRRCTCTAVAVYYRCTGPAITYTFCTRGRSKYDIIIKNYSVVRMIFEKGNLREHGRFAFGSLKPYVLTRYWVHYPSG